MNAQVNAMLREGVSVLLTTGTAIEQRRAAGLAREDYVFAVLLSSAIAFASTLVPELSGVSAAVDVALGNEVSPMSLHTSAGLATAFVTIAAVLIWWGPVLTAQLAAAFRGSNDRMAAAHWIFLTTLASIVITLGVASVDVILGVFALAAPVATGYLSLAMSLVSIIVIVAISAVLARLVCGVASMGASIMFAVVWLCGFLGTAIIGAAPVMILAGG